MISLLDSVQALALLVAANATPLVTAKLLDKSPVAPLDFGYVMRDGERLFGAHKTWRGLMLGTAVCALAAGAFGLPAHVGVGFGAAALVGDALTSALKRRARLPPGEEVLGLDQLGEACVPLVIFARPLALNAWEIVLVTLAFISLDILTTPLRHRNWRKRAH